MEKSALFSRPKFTALCGLFAGAALSYLLSPMMGLLPLGQWNFALILPLYALLMAAGWRMGEKASAAAPETVDGTMEGACPKVLDTSVIIDGRILDIAKSGFLEGEIVIPSFVLDELRHVADSADSQRRARGRRGLDVLKKIQEDMGNQVRIEDWAGESGEEVDVKLLRLARRLSGAVMTNDYNLNKVAGVAGVPVLNINELAGALRPAVLPGEEMTVRIVREGKEPGQGVAYLEDGTMVVVENGKRRVGDTLNAEVTTVLQTSAGRMIFARAGLSENRVS